MNEQSRLLLGAYRPGGADAGDAAFAEALAQAQHDPQLRAWLDESLAFDRAIAERLRAVAVPDGLRATILAGGKISRPRHWWQSPQWWAFAAMLILLAAFAALWQNRAAESLCAWQTDSLDVLDNVVTGAASLDTEHAQPAKLIDWLNAHAAPVPGALPQALADKTSMGCKMIDSQGRTVSLICFDLGDNESAHLFTTPRAGLRFPPPDRHPRFARRKNWNLAYWSDGAQAHMLASGIAPEKLRALLPAFVAAQSAPSSAVLAELLPQR